MAKDPLRNKKVKALLPPEDEIERALNEALREAADSGTSVSGPDLQDVRPNTLVKARVVAVTEDQILVDLHYKSEGVISRSEFGDDPPAPGTEVEAWVMTMENPDGQVALSATEAQRRRIYQSVTEGAGTGETFRGKILHEVKGGLVVDLGVEAFMPAREVDLRYVEDLGVYVGRTVEVQVIETDRERRRVICSRKAVLLKERASQSEALFRDLEIGKRLRGTVTNIRDFGAFVDVGGAEGLLHIGDMAWGRVEDPKEILEIGQEVEVQVLSFDRGAGKISLGLKQTTASPWDSNADRLQVGRRHTGKVVEMLEFGAIAEILPGVRGLVHVSEMRWGQRVNKPGDVVAIGEEVEVEIIEVDPARGKVSLSMKKIEENPWTRLADRYPVPSPVHGTVTRLADFGAFVEVEEGVEGLVHVSEISWTERPDHPKALLEVGQEVTAMVMGVDEERQRLSLSIRNTEPDPWWDVETDFPVGKTFEGVVTRLKPYGAFVSLRTGLEGLIHVTNMGMYGGSRAPVKPQDQVSIEVLEVDEEARRLGLRLIEVLHD